MSRRNDILQMQPAELAIRAAVLAVEKLPADTRLTRAVILLGEAQRKVADFIDNCDDDGQHVAYLRSRGSGARRHLQICDSGAEGAFKVYRR